VTSLPLTLLREVETADAKQAWPALLRYAWQVCAEPLTEAGAVAEVTKRERTVAAVDLWLATAAWDLWCEYEDCMPRASELLAEWWAARSPGRAVLILDGLSLREAPWLVEGAKARGYTVHQVAAAGAELPADTSPFAKALGFGQRSALENNGASGTHRLPGAVTDSVGIPWKEAVEQVTSAADWVLWHHWPDDRLHELGVPGHGLQALTEEASVQLNSDDFWALVHRLTTGRRLLITSDHGYAASGHFPDTTDDNQTKHLKTRFKSGRCAADPEEPSPWVPPIDLVLDTVHGRHAYVLGRRKWKSQGGYPTLTHGGLSLLEVAVPFIELSRTGGK